MTMYRFLRLLAVSITLFVCAGCALLRSNNESAISYGTYPENYRRLITDYMAPFLHDPDSSIYTNWRGPARGFLTSNSGITYGYRVCTDIDFRTKTGAYNGSRLYLFMISNGRVVQHEGGYLSGSVDTELLSRICKGL